MGEAARREPRFAATAEAGFHTPLRVLSAGEALAIRTALEGVEAEQGPVFTENRAHAGAAFQGSYRYKSHLLFKWLADVVRHPAILDAVEDLIGPDILCWTTHWFVKEAHSPQYVSWHQDSNYWGGGDRRPRERLARGLRRRRWRAAACASFPGVTRRHSMAHLDTWAENNMLTRETDHRGGRRVARRQPGARARRGWRCSTTGSPMPPTRTAAATAASA